MTQNLRNQLLDILKEKKIRTMEAGRTETPHGFVAWKDDNVLGTDASIQWLINKHKSRRQQLIDSLPKIRREENET